MKNVLPQPAPLKARIGVSGWAAPSHTLQKEKETQQPGGMWTCCTYISLFIVYCWSLSLVLMLPESGTMSVAFHVEATWHMIAAHMCMQWKARLDARAETEKSESPA